MRKKIIQLMLIGGCLASLAACGDESVIEPAEPDPVTAPLLTATIDQDTDTTGTTATLSIGLSTPGGGDVPISITSSDTGAGTVSAASVTISDADWRQATDLSAIKTVTLTGQCDTVAGDITYDVQVTPDSANYPSTLAQTITVTNQELPSIWVSSTTGATAETGTAVEYTVRLCSQDSATVAIVSSNTAEGVVSPASLAFTGADWNTAQTFTVTGQDDAIADNNVGYQVTLSSSNYAADPVTINLSNTDNEVANLVLTPTSGLAVHESGTTDTVAISLTVEPAADVTLQASVSDSEVTVTPSSLTFTQANYSTAQTLTLAAVDDLIAEDNETKSLTVTSSSSITSYSNLSDQVSFTVVDNDTAGISLTTIPVVVSETVSYASFGVTLDTQPTADVTITPSSGNTSEVVISSPASLTFTSSNWNQVQSVTVAGVRDGTQDGDQTVTVTVTAASADAKYGNPALTNTISVTNTDVD
jgi:hypothetical protein